MEFLEFLEKHRTPFLDKLFSAITYLGWETAFLVVALVMIWCVNKKYGFFILYCGLIGQAVSQVMKIGFKVERPWVANPDFSPVKSAIEEAGGFSFPSGHTQISTTTYGGIALLYRKKKILSAVFVIITLLVAFSRMYLGVHYPLDVIFSLVFNTVIIFALYYIGLRYASPKISAILRFLGILLMGGLFVYSFVMSRGNASPEYADSLEFSSKMFGATVAFAISWYLDDKYLDFKTEAPWFWQLFKVVVGTLVILVIKEGLKPVFHALCVPEALSDFTRYFIVVLFAGYIWPVIFTKCVKRM